MGLLSWLRTTQKERPKILVGCWSLVRSEPPSEEKAVEIEFFQDGRMQYSIDAGDRWQIMKLTWHVEGNTLITDQPSSPRKERMTFNLESDGTLATAHAQSGNAWWRRSARRAPNV